MLRSKLRFICGVLMQKEKELSDVGENPSNNTTQIIFLPPYYFVFFVLLFYSFFVGLTELRL